MCSHRLESSLVACTCHLCCPSSDAFPSSILPENCSAQSSDMVLAGTLRRFAKQNLRLTVCYAVSASTRGAPVHESGQPGQLVPRYFPKILPSSSTRGNTSRWIATGGVITAWVCRCLHKTWAK